MAAQSTGTTLGTQCPVIFPPESRAADIENWAAAMGLRLKSDLHGNLVAVPLGRHH